MNLQNTSQRHSAPLNRISLALSAASLLLFETSCDPRADGFSAKELAGKKIAKNISDERPASIKLDDQTMLCITSVQGSLYFFRAASGYAESGGSFLIASSDSSSAQYYSPVSRLAVLAYFNNDWEKIASLVKERFDGGWTSISPERVANSLRIFAVPPSKYTYEDLKEVERAGLTVVNGKLGISPGGQDHAPAFVKQARTNNWKRLASNSPDAKPSPSWSAYILKNHLEEIVVVPGRAAAHGLHYKLSNGDLLLALEIDEQACFFKTTSGYAVSGGSIKGIGIESSTANKFQRISAPEVHELLHHDWTPLLKAAENQASILEYSIRPEILRAASQPRAQ